VFLVKYELEFYVPKYDILHSQSLGNVKPYPRNGSVLLCITGAYHMSALPTLSSHIWKKKRLAS
jgi:hypothetical protein